MSEQEYDLLDLMLNDMGQAPSVYCPTHFWQHGVEKVVAELKQNGVEGFRSHLSVLCFFVPLYGVFGSHQYPRISNELAKKLCDYGLTDPRLKLALEQFFSGESQSLNDYRIFLATLMASHPFLDSVSESKVGNPLEQFLFDGKRYSRSFLNYLLGLNFIKQHCDLSEVNTVLEIGGGFGSLGEILLGDKRNHCFYIDVDIPPTSYVASYYLQEVFSADVIGTYDVLREEKHLAIDDLRDRYSGVVLCPWQLPQLSGTIDLFVNFISFQEMEPDVVKNYLQHVDRLQTKYILLRNIREGKQKAKDPDSIGVQEPIKGDDYDVFLPNYQLLATNTVPFGYKTVDGFHSELRVYQRKV